MAKSYYQRAHGIVITCAINNRNSFYNLRNWLNSIKDNTKSETIQLIIIANKSDMGEEREVSTEEIAEKAKELKVEYYETSAKDNTNIDEAFEVIITKVFNNTYNKQGGIIIGHVDPSAKKGCC
jgi:GTPase SAR1 family protein